MINARICFAVLPIILVCFAACSDDDDGSGGSSSGADGGASSSSSSSTSSSSTSSSTSSSSSGGTSTTQVFTIDGTPSTSQEKIAVSTYNTDVINLNFGVQALALPTDYTFLLTYRLDPTKTASGTYGMEAVTRVEGLLRNASNAATYSGKWEAADPKGITVELSVTNNKITARWQGPVGQISGGSETKTVEARTTDLPSTKK